jgi:DnaJ-class molecular chaperone
VQEKKDYAIELKPYWKEGTKIRYPGAGDALAGSLPQDVVFIVKIKPHPVVCTIVMADMARGGAWHGIECMRC